MKLTELVLEHIEMTQRTKEASCEHNGGPSDLLPMLVWVNGLDETSVAIIEVKNSVLESMPQVLSLLVKQNPKVVMFICESYAVKLDKTELQEFQDTHKSGDLAKIYAEHGPLSGVDELIAFNALDTDTGEQVQGYTRFHYNDIGLPVFGETEVHSLEHGQLDQANTTMIFNQFYKYIQIKRAENN